MKKKLPKRNRIMVIALTDTAADSVFVELLQYWDAMLTPKKGRWKPPDEIVSHAELRKAIKVLLEFMGK